MVGICAYVTFLVYNKIESSLDIDTTMFTEQLELDEEKTEKEIDFQDEVQLLTMQSVELSIITDQKYNYYNYTHQFSRSSYLEYDTPPPKRFC